MAEVNINAGEISSVRFNEQAGDVSTPAAGYWSEYFKADGPYVIDEDGAVSQIQLLSAIQAGQLANEIKGWPPIVNTGSLNALNLWWDSVGTPSTAPSVVAVSGEGGVTETYEQAIKVVTDAASEGMSQTWTYADEPRIKSGRKLSALLAIWSVSSVSVTAKLVNSDASETAASAVTAAAWTVVEIPNHTLAGTTCALQVTAAAAGTFYVVPLGANIGARGMPLPPRNLVYKNVITASVLNGVDGGGADFADLDFTASTSPLAAIVNIAVAYKNTTAAGRNVVVRRNGDTAAGFVCISNQTTGNFYSRNTFTCAMDDAQILEWKGSSEAADTETIYFDVLGWWEWA